MHLGPRHSCQSPEIHPRAQTSNPYIRGLDLHPRSRPPSHDPALPPGHSLPFLAETSIPGPRPASGTQTYMPGPRTGSRDSNLKTRIQSCISCPDLHPEPITQSGAQAHIQVSVLHVRHRNPSPSHIWNPEHNSVRGPKPPSGAQTSLWGPDLHPRTQTSI